MDVGMVMEEREVQLEKTHAPMVFTEVGMVIEVREVEKEKELFPIPVTVVGIKTEKMFRHRLKA